jgi:hypothetical protein
MAVVVGGNLERDKQVPPKQGEGFKKAAASDGKACANANEAESRTEVGIGGQKVAEDRRAAAADRL